MHLDPDLVTQLDELVDSRGPIDVGGDQQRSLSLLAQADSQLGDGRGLSGPLQSHQHEDRWASGERELPALATKGGDQLVVHDLDDLLAGVQAGEEVGAEGALAYAGHEFLDDTEVHVRLEQGETDLAQRDVEVGLGDLRFSAQAVDHALQAGAQGFEHWLAR